MSSSLSTTDIVGIVIGGVLGLATVIGLAISIYSMCCKKNDQSQVAPHPYPPYQQQGPYGQPMYNGYYPPPPGPYNQQSTLNDKPPAYPGTVAHGKS